VDILEHLYYFKLSYVELFWQILGWPNSAADSACKRFPWIFGGTKFGGLFN